MPVGGSMVFGRANNAPADPASDDEGMESAAPRRRGAGAAGVGASDEVNAAAEAAAAARLMDDEKPVEEIVGAEGEYPLLPKEHQYLYSGIGHEPKECHFGGVRNVEDSEEWQRLIISAAERKWKSCISANFRVVENHALSTCRHLYHAGKMPGKPLKFCLCGKHDTNDGRSYVLSVSLQLSANFNT